MIIYKTFFFLNQNFFYMFYFHPWLFYSNIVMISISFNCKTFISVRISFCEVASFWHIITDQTLIGFCLLKYFIFLHMMSCQGVNLQYCVYILRLFSRYYYDAYHRPPQSSANKKAKKKLRLQAFYVSCFV